MLRDRVAGRRGAARERRRNRRTRAGSVEARRQNALTRDLRATAGTPRKGPNDILGPVQNSGHLRRIIGALLAVSVLAALVSPTAASPIVRKTHRAVVDASSTAGSTPVVAGDADGFSAAALWLTGTICADQNPNQAVFRCANRRGARVFDVLAQSAFGSRPPPFAV